MKKSFITSCIIVSSLYCINCFSKEPAKIVGLIPARNESHIIEQCLHALSLYTDAIVYLDDASDDNSVEIVESIAKKYHVERIIKKKIWYRDEPGDKNALLKVGREIGGTHFIVIDADEMFTANCLDNNFLRNKIVALQPGDCLKFVWIQLWRSTQQYRFDNSIWTWNYKDFVFCDDKKCSYRSEFIHTRRTPILHGKTYTIQGYQYGMLHFQFVNWKNLLVKQAWYRCLERVRAPKKSISSINALYKPSKDEANLRLADAPIEWFIGYDFFDPTIFDLPDNWRKKQLNGWFNQYGKDYFKDLDIWDIDWQ